MALALYRKYRPRTFAEVIGQEHVTEPLSQALRSGRLHHAYLFSGPRGCGKTSSARILARSLNCEQGPTPEPCGVCASCRSLANDGAGSIDVIEIDAASHGGVDDARDLREKAFFAPASSRYKIYVIDEAHMVSSAGFNALLKLVEEPPDYVKFIFATTEPEKVLGTIKSRTHHYPFRLIPPAVLRPYLQQLAEAEGIRVEPAVFPLVTRAGGGSVRDSLSVLDQLIAGAGPEGVSYARAVALLGVTDVTLIDEMCDALAAGDGAAAYSTIDRVAEAGHDPRRYASDLLERFRDLIVLQQVPDAVAKGLIDGPTDQLEAMSAQATRLGPATLSRCADIVHNGLVEMRGTTAPRLLLELITARMLLPGADDTTGALLQRLERMERRLTLTGDEDPPSTSTASTQAPSPPGTAAASGGGLSAARAAAAAAGRRSPNARPAAGPATGTPAAPDPSDDQATAPDAPGPTTDGSMPGAPGPAGRAADRGGSGSRGGGAMAADDDAAYYDDEPPWDDEPEPEFDGRAPAPESSRAGARRNESETRQPAHPPARRAEPPGLMPDAPEEPGAAAVGATPGRLTAAAVREVWPEIVNAIGRQSKKVSALAAGATVRDLDGQTVILTFRYPAHARMLAPEAPLIASALYEALGGEWEVRCEVAGEAGAVSPAATPQADERSPDGRSPSGGPDRSGAAEGAPGAVRGAAAGGRPTRPVGDQRGPADAQTASSGQRASDGEQGFGGQRGSAGEQGFSGQRGSGGEQGFSGHRGSGGEQGSGGQRGSDVEHGFGGQQGSVGQRGPAGPRGSGGQQGADGPRGTGSQRTAEMRRASEAQRASAGVQRAQASTQQAPASAGREPESRRRAAEAPPSGGDDDWPEPAKPGGLAPPPQAAEDDDWPEVSPIGSAAGAAPSFGDGDAPGTPGDVDPSFAESRPGDGVDQDESVEQHGNGAAYAANEWAGSPADGEPGADGRAMGAVPAEAADLGLASEPVAAGGAPAAARGGGARGEGPERGAGGESSSRTGRNAAPGSGLAAARAAARNAAARQTAKPAWSDDAPVDEAPPYEADYAGFDPGDEPLDDVIDEKTARESSEQQAMRLLQDAFGAEKIGES